MAKRKSGKHISGADARQDWEVQQDARREEAAKLDALMEKQRQKEAMKKLEALRLQQEQQRCAVRSRRPKRSPSVLSATGVPWAQLNLFDPGPGKPR